MLAGHGGPSVEKKYVCGVFVNIAIYDLYGPVRNVLMRADSLRRQVGGGLALEIENFFCYHKKMALT
jgi:hypothetical protein